MTAYLDVLVVLANVALDALENVVLDVLDVLEVVPEVVEVVVLAVVVIAMEDVKIIAKEDAIKDVLVKNKKITQKLFLIELLMLKM
jgi:hypothetical protein